MTVTMPPNVPGSRRVLPVTPTKHQVERVRELLDQDERWVLRGDWARYLQGEGTTGMVPVDGLERDQRIAAAAWISQQRHALHAALEDAPVAPEGWLESLPLYRVLSERHERIDLPLGPAYVTVRSRL